MEIITGLQLLIVFAFTLKLWQYGQDQAKVSDQIANGGQIAVAIIIGCAFP